MAYSELLLAMNGRPWLERFRRRDYRDAFLEYTERFGPLYMAAVKEAGEEGLPALASALLDGLEEGWKRHHFWDRGIAKAGEKQMVVDYLSPMLLGLETPGCARLAELLRDGWTARWPKDSYQLASHAEIQSGFRHAILGIEIRK